jgi:Tfp pilus assembly protein PilO
MIGVGAVWRRLWPYWVAAMLFMLGNIAVYVAQTGTAMNRESRLRSDVQELEQEVVRLQRIQREAEADRAAVADIESRLREFKDSILGSPEERLIAILREIGTATRSAGLLTEGYRYRFSTNSDAPLLLFGISFRVVGRYDQIRQLLGEIQTSAQFLAVSRISFSGETDARQRQLDISIQMETYFAVDDEASLRAAAARYGSGGGRR